MKFKIFFLFALEAAIGASEGNQVLHTRPNDKTYQRSGEFIEFVESAFKGAVSLESDAAILRYASDQVGIDGVFIELGTGMGRTTNFLAALNPQKTIYTFDSYLGHPSDWDKGDKVLPKGFFAWPEGEKLPPLLNNVRLIQGWFADTLPSFAQTLEEPVAFLHVDCEIYESTAQALDFLSPKMTEGTILLFDEFYNYPNYRNHEYKAFQEFLEKYSFEAEYLAYNAFHEQAAVRIHRKKMPKISPSIEEQQDLDRVLAEFNALTNAESFAHVFQRIMEPVSGKPSEFFGSDQRIDLMPSLAKLVEKLPSNAQIFDVGAGSGDVVDYALKFAPKGTIVNLEEPNPWLIKEYLNKLEQYDHLKPGLVYTGNLQDYYKKPSPSSQCASRSHPGHPHDLPSHRFHCAIHRA